MSLNALLIYENIVQYEATSSFQKCDQILTDVKKRQVCTLVDVELSGHQVVAHTQVCVMVCVEVSSKRLVVPLPFRVSASLRRALLTRLHRKQTNAVYSQLGNRRFNTEPHGLISLSSQTAQRNENCSNPTVCMICWVMLHFGKE